MEGDTRKNVMSLFCITHDDIQVCKLPAIHNTFFTRDIHLFIINKPMYTVILLLNIKMDVKQMWKKITKLNFLFPGKCSEKKIRNSN